MTVHGGFGKTVEKRLGPPNPRMEHGLLTSVPEEVGDTDRRGRGLLRIVLLQSLLVYALPRLERGLRVARQIGGGCEGWSAHLGPGASPNRSPRGVRRLPARTDVPANLGPGPSIPACLVALVRSIRFTPRYLAREPRAIMAQLSPDGALPRRLSTQERNRRLSCS